LDATRDLTVLALAAALASAGCGAARRDPPLLVPWNRIGDITLGEAKKRVEREYGQENPQEYFRLHGSKVFVTLDGGRVADIDFSTSYYRTKSGFGVGSRIPFGPCHRTATSRCEHRWHGFVFDAWKKEGPCSCWTKVGLGAKSLPATGANYLKPWFIILVKHGGSTEFYFALKYVD